MTFNTFPHGQHHRLQRAGQRRSEPHDARDADGQRVDLAAQTAATRSSSAREYRRIGADARSYSNVRRHLQLHAVVYRGDADGVGRRRLRQLPARLSRRAAASCMRRPRSTWSTTTRATRRTNCASARTLTVNYGLRYEYEPGVREANNQFTVGFDRDADFPVQVPGLALKGGLMYAGENGYPTHQGEALNGVAPRGGFAWSLSNKDVIRGGYGFFWAPMQFSGVGETAMGRLGYTATTTYLASTDGNRTPANSLSDPFPSGITHAAGKLAGPGDRRRRRDRLRRSELDSPARFSSTRSTTRASCRAASRCRSAIRAAGPSTCRSAARWTRR